MPGHGGEKAAEHGGVERARADQGADCHDTMRTPCDLGCMPKALRPGVSLSLQWGCCLGQHVG